MSDKDLANWLILDEAIDLFRQKWGPPNPTGWVALNLESLRKMCRLLDKSGLVRTRVEVEINTPFATIQSVRVGLQSGDVHSEIAISGHLLDRSVATEIIADAIHQAWRSLFGHVLSSVMEAYKQETKDDQ